MKNKDTVVQEIEAAKRSDYLKVARLYEESLNSFSTEEIKAVDTAIAKCLKKEFGKEIKYYFRKMYPNHHFLINNGIWSFLTKKNFPVSRFNIGSDEGLLVKQEENLSYLRGASKYYSTIDEFVASGIQSAFYFDRKDEQLGEMIIHEIDVNSKEVLNEIEIKGTHREKIYPLDRFSFTSLDEYKRAREGYLITEERNLNNEEYIQEISYQNQVIRWYVRIGLFNPLNVIVYRPNAARNLGNSTKNLITERQMEVDLDDQKMKEFQKTLKAQFHSSIKEENRKEGYTIKQDKALDEVIDYLFKAFPDHIAARLYTFDTGFFDLSQHENHISHIYWVPLLTGKVDKPTGGVQYINTDKPLHDKNEKDDLLYTASILTHLFSGQFDDSQMKEIDYINEKTTANSAGVSIMSRNISHNIGSHAISYEKNALMTWRSMLDNGALEGLVYKEEKDGKFYFVDRVIKAVGDKYELDILNIEKTHDFKFKYLEAVGFFLGYLQERIDYTSAVASGTSFYYGKVHLVDDIILHFLRGNKSIQAKKKLEGWTVDRDNRNILLERIVLSEDYHKEDIVIEYPNKKEHLDVVVSLPTGVTGRQSIFAMLENIIRNTAKHGVSKEERGGKIKIRIDVDYYNDDYYKLSIIDNSGVAVTSNKLSEIQKSIEGSLMDGGVINERQKGIKEIQIAAAWLRGIEPRDIKEKQKSKEPILEVDAFPNQKNVEGLRFQLFIKKAKEVLLIGDSEIKKRKLPDSWRAIAYSDLKSIVKATQYNFVLFDKNSPNELLKTAKLDRIPLPIRHLEYDFSQIKFNELGDVSKRTEIEAEIYATWLDVMDERIKVDTKTQLLKIGIVDDRVKKIDEYPASVVITGTAENTLRKYIEKKNKEGENKEKKKESIDIIYRAHANLESLKLNYPEIYEGAVFIESITGNNSTSRILREEKATAYWGRKIQESAACKVMIIDERIWKETIRPKENDQGFYAVPEEEYNKTTKKRIYMYTIRAGRDKDMVYMEVVNLKNEVEGLLKENGTIHWESKVASNFHFASFHQGLLDKIYNYFNISDKGKKEKFFKEMKHSTKGTLMYYLHSGRSFTPELPKETGFIPLSSLDVAMRDCKLLLTDLLFSGALINKENDGE